MKQLITLFILLISLAASAQTEHMKFMGIPINGNITAFQSKLVQKGFKFVKNGASSGEYEVYKQYSGKFAGKECTLFVSYDRKTKIVYDAQVAYSFYYNENYESKRDDMYESLTSQLSNKYPNAIRKNGENSTTFIFDNGSIRLHTKNELYEYSNEGHQYLYVTYTDNINYNKSKSSFVSDDL